MKHIDIEELEAKGQMMASRDFPKPTPADVEKYKPLVKYMLSLGRVLQPGELNALKKKHRCNHKNSFLFHVFQSLDIPTTPDQAEKFRRSLMIKACKSWSGITSITVFTSAYPEFTDATTGERKKQSFSCAYNCSFCPNQPGQPRSYILNEPGVLRANRNEFDCVRQIHDRMNSLYVIGHPDLGKLEVLVLGGTFASYPKPYREEFTRDIYYAANTFWDSGALRERLSLDEEKWINKTAKSRVIGLTFETRGDTIDADEMRFLRRLGCTRIQMGIQHIDDAILDKNNRKCAHKTTVKAIELLKTNCWKIDGHFMPNLPFSTAEKDRDMLIDKFLGLRFPVPKRHVDASGAHWEVFRLTNPELQVDQVKIYPTAVTVYTQIEEWYKQGIYKPYPEAEFESIMLDFKSLVFPWIRINRIIRDFFADAIFSESGSNLGMRNDLGALMATMGTRCPCIRCREVKNKDWDGKYDIVVRQYDASNGDEYFISAESPDRHTLYGFVRLRLDTPTYNADKVFPELQGAALIRELHVYSQLTNVGEKGRHVQHKGIGTRLMSKAEAIAAANKYGHVAVIAGIGAQTFYERIGYHLHEGPGEFMVKYL